MSKDKAPRRFLIDKLSMTTELVRDDVLISDPRRQLIPAIEFSAYLELEAKLAECVAALEFYADYKSWAAYGYSDEFESIIKDSNKCKDRDHDIIGGRRAREVLARVKK